MEQGWEIPFQPGIIIYNLTRLKAATAESSQTWVPLLLGSEQMWAVHAELGISEIKFSLIFRLSALYMQLQCCWRQ